jgi:pSer/pThr/pTyr-binding forkhead associated (FHA) protein
MTDDKMVESPVEISVSDMVPRLEAIDGPLIGRTFYLDKPVVSIGRLAENDICLEDSFVSRHHCVIRNVDGQYVIEDLNSANGTYVNGERVNACSLAEGDLIRIGASRFEVGLQNTEGSMAVSQNLFEAKNVHAPFGVSSVRVNDMFS